MGVQRNERIEIYRDGSEEPVYTLHSPEDEVIQLQWFTADSEYPCRVWESIW